MAPDKSYSGGDILLRVKGRCPAGSAPGSGDVNNEHKMLLAGKLNGGNSPPCLDKSVNARWKLL